MLKKAALVTGAVRNSGLGIARKFLQEGVPTFITSRVEEDAVKVAEELTKEFGTPCFGLGFAPRNAKEETDPMFKKIEEKGYYIDSMICNAADLGLGMDPLTVEADAWEDTILTNIMGYFLPARCAARQMIANGDPQTGTIVFIGSINYRDVLPGRSAYIATKGAIRSMTKGLALDFAPYGIRVNCIAPGPIWTTRYDAWTEEQAKERTAVVPLNSITTKEQMGNFAFFLSSEVSQNMTGSVLIVDGGMDCVSPVMYK
jgi:NAD(P)-dependent dehydrogenase (short-subunit alcohol dehydrogenase family)